MKVQKIISKRGLNNSQRKDGFLIIASNGTYFDFADEGLL
jgi:hypothetical protein